MDNPSQYDDEEFTYDNVGNRLTAADTTGAWAYNQNNELGGFDTTSFVYDDNGNMVQKTVDGVVTSYVYNVEDRLSEVWDGEAGTGTLVAEYYYDPFGRRLWKEVSGVRTHYHYADEGLIGEYDATGTEIKTYGYKPNSTWTTDPLFMKVGTEYYFYHNDHLGTPQKMTGVNGAVVWSAKYSSFGKAEVDAASTVTNNLRFPGQYEDAESGLYYNWNRYYDPSSGRYLTPDPLKLAGGINLFAYAGNNSVNWIDPWGLRLTREQNAYVAAASALGGFVGYSGTLNPLGGMIGGGLTAFVATMTVEGDWDMNDLVTNTAVGMLTGLAGGYFGQAVAAAGTRAIGFGVFGFGIDAAVYGANPQLIPRNDRTGDNVLCEVNVPENIEEDIEFTEADYQQMMDQMAQIIDTLRRNGHI